MAELVQVKGLAELNRALEQLPRNISKNVLRGAVNAAAQVVRKEVSLRVPVKTGQLKRAVYRKHIPERSSATRQTYYVSVRSGKRYQAGATYGKNKDKTRTAKTSSDAFYARFIELGHYTRPPGKTLSKSGQMLASRIKRGRGRASHIAALTAAGQVRWVPPQPFMRPAWEAKKNEALQVLADYMRKRLPVEAAKLKG